ncbi:hypothetical protein QT196_31030 [Streptomyces sp. P9-2B-2]|uniref:hypothetical protein n=1 Tax=Streptomyces TaxID=1883 RepID=UPI0022577CCC|nr:MULTISPECIES: hypothetical protein [Streptomyces]MCX4634917.1 hypothetical protein [Streptomyces platensis]WJY43154.1 hypothetical protein QT196_31030 [Streptomyces sp. P9-2B-2]
MASPTLTRPTRRRFRCQGGRRWRVVPLRRERVREQHDGQRCAAVTGMVAGPRERSVTAQSPRTDTPPARYDDLRALVFNCTLKRSPERSNTQGRVGRARPVL